MQMRLNRLDPPYEEVTFPVPPDGTLTAVSSGAAALVSTQWLHDVNEGKIKPGDLSAVLEALKRQEAEEDAAGYMVSVVKRRSGIDNTLFVSTKGNSRHAPRLKIAIDPPNSLNENAAKTSMALHDYSTVGEYVPPRLLEQVKTFIELNRTVLLDYWEAKIDSEMMLEQLKAVPSRR